jgi:hypothetical protein
MFTIEDDFHGWLLDQAAALRARDYESLDWDHLAEELETMGARERRELNERLKNLLLHLLKFKYQTCADAPSSKLAEFGTRSTRANRGYSC